MCNPFEEIGTRLSNIEKILQELRQIEPPKYANNSRTGKHFLSVKDASELLKVSGSTIYNLVSKQEIPVCKKGKRLYFSEEELLSWLKAGRKQTVDEMKREAMQGTISSYAKRKNKHH